MAETRPLFGGAIMVQVPTSFRDVSDVRQVPDNQEAFQNTENGQLLVVEILELQSVDDEAAAAYFFQDLCEANGVSAADCEFVKQDVVHAIQGLPPTAVVCFGRGRQKVALGREVDVVGNPRIQEVRVVDVELCVIRLPAVQSDVLITLSTPSQLHPQDNSSAPSNVFRDALASFQIRDWSLFG